MNTTKTFFALMGATLLSANALADPSIADFDANGDKTISEDEKNWGYELKSADDLYWFMEYVNNNAVYDENADADLTKANAFLANNITVNNDLFSKLDEDGTVKSGEEVKEWFPIGYYNSINDIYYSGTFDGNGHTISGLYFNNENQGYVGLFGQTFGGATIIKNVGVVDSYIKGKSNIGGVCGYSWNGTITNCYNTGKVSGGDESWNIGGVCGYNEGTITNCYNTGKVSGGGGSYYIGGVCGYNEGTITNCYNRGEVSGGDKSSYIGGVCGYNDNGTITNCYNSNSGKVSGGNEIGGVCGRNQDGTITNCNNSGEVSGGDENWYIGGVCGSNLGTITNCYNSGKVSGGNESSNIGGVCGYSWNCTITNCYNSGKVSGGNDSYNIGGVCGNNDKGTITNCYNSGKVSGGDESWYIGGVCGYSDGTIENCYDFKLNSGTLSEYSIVVENNTIALPTEDMVSREGYQFDGWYNNTDCEGDGITSEVEFDDVHTLYAKWTEGSTPTAIKAVEAESNKTIKTIKDGQIVIIRNGVMYDMQGRKL